MRGGGCGTKQEQKQKPGSSESLRRSRGSSEHKGVVVLKLQGWKGIEKRKCDEGGMKPSNPHENARQMLKKTKIGEGIIKDNNNSDKER